MSPLLVILMGTVLVNTFLLMQNDEALGGTRAGGSVASAMRIGGATSVVLLASALTSNLIWNVFDHSPSDALLFIHALVIVCTAVLLDRVTVKRFPALARALTTSPLLIVSNAIALGTGMLTTIQADAVGSLLVACTLGASFVAALTLFVALASRIATREVPAAFRGAPITLVSAGLLTLALMGFTGLLRG